MTMILYYRVSAKILPYIWFIYSTLILDRISSVPARTGKQWFYIHISWQKNPRPWDVKNPDRIGVFRGYIFFAYPLWCARQDLNPHPLGMGPKPIASAYSATGAHIFFNSFSLWKSKYLIVTPRQRYLNLVRLPVPPYPHFYISTAFRCDKQINYSNQKVLNWKSICFI